MKGWEQAKNWYSTDLEQKKSWYSPAADAYNKARPRYSKKLIARVVELAELPVDAAILEIGCGPGIATVAFAELGYSIVCLEPNQEFCHLARLNCASYPQVEIQQTSFEEWKLEPKRFNAVLAATSIHWIASEVRYTKTAAALEDNGALILLWNTPPQPDLEICQELNDIYQMYAPDVGGYEDTKTHEVRLKAIAQNFIDSGLFKNLVSEHLICKVTYSIDNYLLLLSTLSPYIALDSQSRDSLFLALKDKLEKNYGNSLQLSYLCAFHFARKI